MNGPRRLLPGAMALVSLLWLGGLPATPSKASVITIDQVLVEANVNDYTSLKAEVEMSFDADVLTVVLRNTSGLTSGPSAGQDAGNLLTGLGFSLPEGVDILGTSSVSLGQGSALLNTASFTQDDWGYGNSASGQLHGIDYGLKSSTGNAGPPRQPAIEDQIEFTLCLSGLDATTRPGLLTFIDANPVVAAFGSPNSVRAAHSPEPASLIVWFVIGLSWAGAAWRHQYRRRWQKWQQEEAMAGNGVCGPDLEGRFAAGPAEVRQRLGAGPAARSAARGPAHRQGG
jgi:hypothetical protein